MASASAKAKAAVYRQPQLGDDGISTRKSAHWVDPVPLRAEMSKLWDAYNSGVDFDTFLKTAEDFRILKVGSTYVDLRDTRYICGAIQSISGRDAEEKARRGILADMAEMIDEAKLPIRGTSEANRRLTRFLKEGVTAQLIEVKVEVGVPVRGKREVSVPTSKGSVMRTAAEFQPTPHTLLAVGPDFKGNRLALAMMLALLNGVSVPTEAKESKFTHGGRTRTMTFRSGPKLSLPGFLAECWAATGTGVATPGIQFSPFFFDDLSGNSRNLGVETTIPALQSNLHPRLLAFSKCLNNLAKIGVFREKTLSMVSSPDVPRFVNALFKHGDIGEVRAVLSDLAKAAISAQGEMQSGNFWTSVFTYDWKIAGLV